MSPQPKIQLALDYFHLAPALAMAQRVKDQVEIIEIGTPLTKASGMLAVRTLRELCPDHIILADIKSPDVGGGEARMAFNAGADWSTVMGTAARDTIRLAQLEADSRPDHELLVDLTAIPDPISSAQSWRELGVKRLVYHKGWDEGNHARGWEEHDRSVLAQLIGMGFKLSVAGALTAETIPFFEGLDLSVLVVGRAIREAADPAASARAIRKAVDHSWPT